MFCMPRLMLRTWCVSADLGRVHWQSGSTPYSLLVCTSRMDGAKVPRCRVRLASSWARAVWSLETGMAVRDGRVWLSISWYCPSCSRY